MAQRLVADGETVVDVPAKLSARARVFSTGQGRKTDATDAHAIAVVAVRTPGLRQVAVDEELVALRLLADRRDELGRRPHPHGQPAAPAAARARPRWRTTVPVRHAGQGATGDRAAPGCRRAAPDGSWPPSCWPTSLCWTARLKDSDKRLTEAVAATGTGLPGLYGIGPVGAARILGGSVALSVAA